ncbi:hypothetical protein H310_05471 [Aphanomyces invadans]|uniref:RanBD1 domain-containing protein n=1 Tax=Aphanomyces invadans TaxID=157072 RepID=A0A024UA00_9STRA|nr:hypothetical protein H310_05471 [Aphanomyces invadans]ETW03040.1 hypothetical protein H310_05471 [Aphanomyces invadans]|eukprot:XP_008868424.1 hypothetical protein H310_05471 [Aphanomyces invadans]
MNKAASMSSPHAKSPLNKRPRVNTEGHDGTDRGHKEEEADALPVSPSKKTASPSKPHTKDDQNKAAPATSAFGFSAFANTNPFQPGAPTSTAPSTGFAAFASGGFGTSSSTGLGFGSGGFGRSSGGFETTASSSESTAATFGGDKTDESSTWTDANDTNADFLNAEADKVEVQHLIVPKVELPKDYQHMTGEEDEDVLLVTTAKLYKLVDKDYVECGGGPFKVLEPKDKSTRGRVVMRRATSDFKAGTQLLLNSLLSSIPSAVVKGKSIIMPVLVDASKITTYCIRFESAEYADKLQQLIQNAN